MRELDALVAEKVMGWKSYDRKDGVREWCKPGEKISIVGTVVCLDRDWDPSTSISDAWLVVEKLDWDITLEYVVMHGWRAVIKRPDLFEGFGQADTAPEAICRAALEAVK